MNDIFWPADKKIFRPMRDEPSVMDFVSPRQSIFRSLQRKLSVTLLPPPFLRPSFTNEFVTLTTILSLGIFNKS